jgi:hypothetical protein
VWTPLIPATMPEDKLESFGTQSPLGRAAQPAELAPFYVFLASQESSYMTAEVLGVTGGSPSTCCGAGSVTQFLGPGGGGRGQYAPLVRPFDRIAVIFNPKTTGDADPRPGQQVHRLPSTRSSPAPTSASAAPRSVHQERTPSRNAGSAPCAANASTIS